MAKDKGMSTVEFAKYYQAKRFEFLKLSAEEVIVKNEACGSLTEEMNKLIEVVNNKSIV